MDKKLTPLEAWEEIKRQIGSATYIRNDTGAPQITTMRVKDTGLFEIIDDALTRLQFQDKLDNLFISLAGGREAGKTALTKSICDKLRAFEIIKEFAEIEYHRIVIFIPLVDITENRRVLRNEENEKKFEFLKEILCLKNC